MGVDNKMKNIRYLILFATVLMLVGCSSKDRNVRGIEQEPSVDLITLNEVIREANDLRKSTLMQEPELYLHNMDEKFNLLTDEQLIAFTTKKDKKEMITLEKGLEDIESAFYILKAFYGAYQYFGGDEVFNKAKMETMDYLRTLGQKDKVISSEELRDVLCEGLSFIRDGHFVIENKFLNKFQYTYCNVDFDIIKSGDDYWILYNEKYYKILKIQHNEELEYYIKYTIDQDGNLMYGIFQVMDAAIASEKGTLELQYGDEVIQIEFSWSMLLPNREKHELVYERTEVKGIPVIRISSTSVTVDGLDSQLNDFVRSATYDKKNKSMIIDLRGNGGGDDQVYEKWFVKYSNYQSQRLISVLKKKTRLSYLAQLSTYDEWILGLDNPSEIHLNDILKEEWSEYHQSGKWTTNENRLYVLIDKRVASSGEGFVSLLRTLDNVVFVGSNTAGMTFSLANSYKYLPNSGIYMYFGEGICIYENAGNKDTIGFLPDIWVSPEEALELVVKMHSNYAGVNE